MGSRFRAAVEQARKSGDLYFASLLSKERITTSLRESREWFQFVMANLESWVKYDFRLQLLQLPWSALLQSVGNSAKSPSPANVHLPMLHPFEKI